jgi:hypothetical protein
VTTVLQAITSQVSDARTRLAMALGALLEGGTLGASGFGVGDNGNSHGPFQINAPYHPDISVTDAENPTEAVAYMLPRYQSAVGKIPASLWQSDPEKAAEQAAFIAENPAQDYYVARGSSTVNDAYAAAKAALSGQPITATGGSSSSSSTSTGSAGGTVNAQPASLLSGVGKSVGMWVLKGVLVLGGVALVAAGLYRASGVKPPSVVPIPA